MAKKRNIAETVADATLPKTPVIIGGKEYDLCCDFGMLSEAETKINRELVRAGRPERVNLLYAIAEENLANVRILFAASLRTFHPELSYDEALALFGPTNAVEVLMALREAYEKAMPEKKADPPAAQASE